MAKTSETDEKVMAALRFYRREGAVWTSDISHTAKLPTATTLRALQRLEKAGKARRVVEGGGGYPSSWELVS